MMRRAEESARAQRQQAAVAARDSTAPNAGGTVEQRLADCVETVRRATKRHTTYKTEAARALALCQRYGVDWKPWRQQLIDAYVGTLSPTEIAQRQSTSINGVIAWLEARASS
jgi:hypothetical protein